MKEYSKSYSKKGFWNKIRLVRFKVGFLRDALAMFYCLTDSTTPIWAKTLITAALGYFIFPFDIIPDMLIPFGYTDDAIVIAACMVGVRLLLKEEHWLKADRLLRFI